MNKQIKNLLRAGACALAVGFAEVCSADVETGVWTSTTGGCFSVNENWQAGHPPAAWDYVELYGSANGAPIVYDQPSSMIYSRLTCLGSHDVTIEGENLLKLYPANNVIRSTTNLTIRVPVQITAGGDASISANNASGTAALLTFDKDLEAVLAAGKKLTFVQTYDFPGEVITFNGAVRAAGVNIVQTGTVRLRFNGPLTAESLQCGIYWQGVNWELNAATNDCKAYYVGAASTLYFKKPNALAADSVLDFLDQEKYLAVHGTKWTGGVHDLAGDQTFDHVNGIPPVNVDGNACDMNIVKANGGTLTMKCSVSTNSYAAWKGSADLVFDPTGNVRFAVMDRVNTLVGRLTVKNGTFCLGGTTTFANLTSVDLTGGTLELATTADGALAGCSQVDVCAGSVLQLGSGAKNPFGANAVIRIAGDGCLALAAGVSVVAAQVLVDGIPVAKGTYNSSSCAWISGDGSVEVTEPVSVWKSATDGDWSDSANWAGGVPTANTRTYIMASGADFTVTATAADVMPKQLFVENTGAGHAILTGDMSFTNAWISIGRNGRIVTGEGQTVFYTGVDRSGTATVGASAVCDETTSPISIAAGGEWLVNGGQLTLTNYAGHVRVFGTEASTGRLQVASGTLNFARRGSSDTLFADGFGEFAFCGTGRFVIPDTMPGSIPFSGAGGHIVFKDNARAYSGDAAAGNQMLGFFGWHGNAKVDLLTSYNGTATWYAEKEVGFGCVAASDAFDYTFNFADITINRAKYGFSVAATANGNFNITTSGKSVVHFGSGAILSANSWRDNEYQPGGILVGFGAQGAYATVPSEPILDGTLCLHAGSTMTDLAGSMVVGAGYARGRLEVDGGALTVSTASEATYPNRNFVIGAWGGEGVCEVSSGSVTVGGNAWIGGCSTNQFVKGGGYGFNGKNPLKNSPYGREDAVGSFVLSGGSVDFRKKFVVGAAGTGSVESRGKGGSFVAGDIVLTNSTVNADSFATVTFTLDENGVAPLVATNALVIGSRSRLVVDTTAYPAGGRSVRLFSCKTCDGEFAPGNVTLTGAFAEKARLVYKANGIRLQNDSGMQILVR